MAQEESPPLIQQKSLEALARLLPDASTPIPPTSAAVIEEVDHLVDWLIARFPDDPDSYEVAARVRFWLGDPDSAVKYWETCLALNPDYAYAYHGMGLVAAKKGDHAKAAELFRTVLRFAPNAPVPQLDLATALVTLGEMEEAAAVLEQHVKVARDPTPGWILLGKAYLNLGRPQRAKEAYQAAVRLHADSADARFGLATAYARLGESEQSAREMAKFKELMAGEKAARKVEKTQRDDAAEMRAGLAATYRTVSRVCRLGGAPQEAEQFARRAFAISPQASNALPNPDDPRKSRMGR